MIFKFLIVVIVFFTIPAWSAWPESSEIEEEWQKVFLRDIAPILNKKETSFSLLLRYGNTQDLYPSYTVIDRELSANAILQYGISKSMEISLKVPLSWSERNVVIEKHKESNGEFGIGDLSLDFKNVLIEEDYIFPEMICLVGISIPTGTNPYTHDIGLGLGHWFVTLGTSFIKSFDPVILFGGLSYNYVVEEKYNNIDYDLGDVFNYSWGVGVVLNKKFTISWEIIGKYQDKLRVDPPSEMIFSSSEAMMLRCGVTYVYSKKFILGSYVSFGSNKNVPDAIVDLSFTWKI